MWAVLRQIEERDASALTLALRFAVFDAGLPPQQGGNRASPQLTS